MANRVKSKSYLSLFLAIACTAILVIPVHATIIHVDNDAPSSVNIGA